MKRLSKIWNDLMNVFNPKKEFNIIIVDTDFPIVVPFIMSNEMSDELNRIDSFFVDGKNCPLARATKRASGSTKVRAMIETVYIGKNRYTLDQSFGHAEYKDLQLLVVAGEKFEIKRKLVLDNSIRVVKL